MLHIAPFSSHHAAGVVSLILPIQQAEFQIPVTLDAQPDLQDIPNFYQQGNGNFWVALHEEQVIGTTALLDIGNRQCALRKMFVAAEFRGREHGIAVRLLETLISWSRARDVREIYLGTTAQFLAAHRFYEKHEFQEIARIELPERFPVMAVDTKFYRRAL